MLPASALFKKPIKTEQIIAAVSLILLTISTISCAAFGSISLGAVIVSSAVGLNVGLWIRNFKREPALGELKELRSKRDNLETQLRSARTRLDPSKRRKIVLGQEESDAQRQVDIEENLLESKERAETSRIEARIRAELSSIKDEREAIRKQQAAQMQVLDNGIGRILAQLKREIFELDQAEADELAAELKRLQREHIFAWLSGFKIIDASISGIGPKFKLQLMRAGLHTAADVDYRVGTIPGIGPVKQAAIQAWHASLLQRAQQKMPQGIPKSQEMAIRNKYLGKKTDLETRRRTADQQYDDEAKRIKAPHLAALSALDGKQQRFIADANAEALKIKEAYANQRQDCSQKRGKLAEDLKRKIADIDVGISEIHATILRLHWEKGKLDRAAMGFRGVNFRNYVKRMLRTNLVT